MPARQRQPVRDRAPRFCDGLARRSFLQIGSLALGGLSLPQVLTGGDMRTGQVIGSTNRLGEYATERPVHFQEVFATLYHRLGIDVNTATITDLGGRPRFLLDVDTYQPLREVI